MWIGQEPLQSGPERSKRLQENPKRAARVTRSLSVGMIVPPTVGPLWDSEVQPEVMIRKIMKFHWVLRYATQRAK